MTTLTTNARGELWSYACSTSEMFARWHQSSGELRTEREAIATRELARLGSAELAHREGLCWACGSPGQFLFDRRYAPVGQVNWRERLVCTRCQLNSRLRLALHVAEDRLGLRRGDRVFLTEDKTPFARVIRERGWAPMTSEFMPGVPRGTSDQNGTRSEDLTQLTFGDASFDALLSFDVLEHVPDYLAALTEIRRVVRPGGVALLSFPFVRSNATHVVRARVAANGAIEHLLPEEYHGDPLGSGKGILCFYHFGWQILDELRGVGFTDVAAHLYWSSDYAYIGVEQILFLCR